MLSNLSTHQACYKAEKCLYVQGEISGTKRPRDADDDPAAKKRNRRLFGSLLGTLSKFK